MAEIPAGALSAEQLQTLAQLGANVQPSGGGPVAALVASMPGASPAQLLQAAAATPGLALGVAQRFVPDAGSLTFENPFRHPRREFLQRAAFEVLSSGTYSPGAPSPRQLTQLPGPEADRYPPFGGSVRGDPQVNFPRPGAPIYVPGTAPPGANRLPVPYEPPMTPGAVFPGGIGVILGGIIAGMWEGWPNTLDPELGPYPTRAPRGAPNDETPAEGPDFGPPSQQQIPGDYIDNPASPPFPVFPGDTGSTVPEDVSAGPVPDSTYGPPQGARQPAPTAPAQTSPPWQRWVWPAIGALGAIQLGRVGRSRSSQTVPSVPVTVGLDLGGLEQLLADAAGAPAPGSSSTTYNFTQAGGSGAYDFEDPCNCGSKKRGKKRKCLAWGQLTWRSGPKKGKPAGRRCVRFAPD